MVYATVWRKAYKLVYKMAENSALLTDELAKMKADKLVWLMVYT